MHSTYRGFLDLGVAFTPRQPKGHSGCWTLDLGSIWGHALVLVIHQLGSVVLHNSTALGFREVPSSQSGFLLKGLKDASSQGTSKVRICKYLQNFAPLPQSFIILEFLLNAGLLLTVGQLSGL